MSANSVGSNGYSKLLAKHVPKPLRTKTEYQRLLKIARDFKRPDLTTDEAMFLDLIGGLIERYEEEHLPIPESEPKDALIHLLEEHEITQAEFARRAGVSRQIVTDILKGRRRITAAHRRKFADFFGVTPAAFAHSG